MGRKRAAAPAAGSGDDAPPPKKTKTQEPYERKEHVKRAFRDNPTNVFVMGPPGQNWVDSAAFLAGYLGWSGTLEQFRQFLLGTGEPGGPSRLTNGILENYNSIRSSNFGSTTGTASGGKDGATGKPIAVKHIWAALEETDPAYVKLFQANVNLPLSGEDSFQPGDVAYPVAVHVAAMSFLIHNNPQIFTASHRPEHERQYCVGVTKIVAEDWYRAMHLVKFYFRHNSAAKRDTGFFSKDRSKQDPKRVDYFAPEEIAELDEDQPQEVEGDNLGQTTASLLQDAYEELSPADIDGQNPFHDEASLDDFVEKSAIQWEVAIDEADKVSRKRDAAALGSAGRVVKRPPLTKGQLRHLCERLGKMCKIKHDDASMEDVLAVAEQPLTQEAVQDTTQVRWQTIV